MFHVELRVDRCFGRVLHVDRLRLAVECHGALRNISNRNSVARNKRERSAVNGLVSRLLDLPHKSAARLAHLEEKKGRLEPGMQADFAAYEKDPLAVDDPRDVRPVLTVSRGREVYAR